MNISEIISEIQDKQPERIIISNKAASDYEYKKQEIRRLLHNKKIIYQISSYTEKQVFQKNIETHALGAELSKVFPEYMRQLNVFYDDYEQSIKMSKGGKLLTHKNMLANKSKKSCDEGHNRRKKYILQEGTVIPPLQDMGIFTAEGKVVSSMYDKYRQINRFVEIVDDVISSYNKEEIHIIDFGCGKSYLTFILYYYLTEVKHITAHITGLDLKADVIEKCNAAAEKYGYTRLRFELGDINGYKTDKAVDMVVTLHACDTATDYALYNAVTWNARYILSVPCCQHELNKQIESDTLAPMMKYGLIKERMAALATDALRGEMLEYRGYKTQLMEFVDMAHSPKNILIRAVKSNIPADKRNRALQEAQHMCEELHATPTIVELLR